jgi:tRNA A-37 threonylcarbamoyl transferase component Bud32
MEMIGRTLSRYRLLQEVGHGGMAVVYKAEDTTLHREVAVKVLHPHLAGQEESRARLQREAHAVAKLRHENILEIFDYSGPDSAESYIVTEFIHGRTLKSFMVEHPLPFPELAEMIASEVARALEHAHQFGVIHRDVKPENVMIRDDGLIKLTDFGIAQIVDKERMTVTGQLLGSPAYMAPEHVEGRPLDFRTDVFAVGILTYQLATGELPFRGKNPHEVLKRIAECKFAPADSVNPLVGKRLGRLIEKALAREPDDRFADVADMRRELIEDLADVGVDDPRQTLRGYFADPKGWAHNFRPRLVAALTATGRERAAAGRTAAALELWGRALCLEPKDVALRGLVDRVAQRSQRGKRLRLAAMTLAGGCVAISAAAMGLHWQHGRHKDAALKTASPAANGAPVVNKALPPPPREDRHVTAPQVHRLRPLRTAPLVAPAPPPNEPPRMFELAPTPKAVSVFLDDKLLGDYGPQLARLAVPSGPHVVRFESPYCFAKEVEIRGGEPAGRLAARLRWKPARLTVRVVPDNADVLVDGSILRSGQPIDVNIPELSDGKKTVSVRVSAPGHASQQLSLELRANDQKVQAVSLAAEAAPQ